MEKAKSRYITADIEAIENGIKNTKIRYITADIEAIITGIETLKVAMAQ